MLTIVIEIYRRSSRTPLKIFPLNLFSETDKIAVVLTVELENLPHKAVTKKCDLESLTSIALHVFLD